MTDTEKLNILINKLKEFAETKHCYDENPNYLPSYNGSEAFDDGIEYGEINFARTLLESNGVDFVYPCMKEND